jgi:V8-like Glu-specific endopeptidase
MCYKKIMTNINTNNRLRWTRNPQSSMDVFTRSDGQFRTIVFRGANGDPVFFHDSRRRIPVGTTWLEQNINGQWEHINEFESERLARISIPD